MKFPDDARLSPEARDLICRLLCDVEHRLGSGGADQIKVLYWVYGSLFNAHLSDAGYSLSWFFISSILRLIPGSEMLNGINSTKWRQHLSLRSRMNWIPRISWSLMKYVGHYIFLFDFLIFYLIIGDTITFQFLCSGA